MVAMSTKEMCVALALLAAPVALAQDADAGSDPWVVYPGGEGPGAGVRVVLVSGDEEYRSEEALPMLGRLLAERHGFHCTVLFAIDPETGEINPDQSDHIPGLAALDEADLMILFTRFRHLPNTDMKHVADYVESGKPLLGIRTATHAFAYPKESASPYAHWSWRSEAWPGGFGRQVLGETWVNHHGHHGVESTRGVVAEAAREHPILRGVDDVWGPTDVYGIRDLPDDATVLLEGSVRAGMTPEAPAVEGEKNDPRMPIVWIRERDLGNDVVQRILCSTIGASQDFASEDLRRLFVNATYWGVGLEERIPERAAAEPVADYAPTPFGFGAFTKGKKPADYAPSAD